MSKPKTKRWSLMFDEVRSLELVAMRMYTLWKKSIWQVVCIKELRNRSEEKARFLREIQTVKENAVRIPGIVPVIADDCENFWYTMPIAQPVMERIPGMNLKEIIQGVLQLCETLEQLHDRKIYHRDIKPSNIYDYNNRFSLGDF